MSFEIPAGLTDLLQDFTVAVLRVRPTDLHQFAADYFKNLNETKSASKTSKKGVTFGGSAGSDDEPMQTDSSDEEPMIGMYSVNFGCRCRRHNSDRSWGTIHCHTPCQSQANNNKALTHLDFGIFMIIV